MKNLVILLSALLLISCENSASYDNLSMPELRGEVEETTMANKSARFTDDEANDMSNDYTPTDAQIIKTAHLTFQTSNPEQTHNKVLELVAEHRGFIGSDNTGKNYNRIYRNMVVRIPTNKFQAVVDGISEGVQYFDQKRISREDVTEEFIDLEARIKAKTELEQRYLELLSKANNVKDMLEIERELSKIREEIEAREGRLKYLKNKVQLSTIYVEFYEITEETGVTVSYGQKMLNALKRGWNGVSVFLLGVLSLWPLFLILLIVIALVLWLVKRNKR